MGATLAQTHTHPNLVEVGLEVFWTGEPARQTRDVQQLFEGLLRGPDGLHLGEGRHVVVDGDAQVAHVWVLCFVIETLKHTGVGRAPRVHSDRTDVSGIFSTTKGTKSQRRSAKIVEKISNG